jgi:hypothetical protein
MKQSAFVKRQEASPRLKTLSEIPSRRGRSDTASCVRRENRASKPDGLQTECTVERSNLRPPSVTRWPKISEAHYFPAKPSSDSHIAGALVKSLRCDRGVILRLSFRSPIPSAIARSWPRRRGIGTLSATKLDLIAPAC